MSFPAIDLPVAPPYPPMESVAVSGIPEGTGWQYEPKWDGFRCLAFRKGDDVLLQSKSGQPLTRYFPEVVQALAALRPSRFVLDGELVIVRDDTLAFDDLLQRIHPAESRVRRLAAATPALFIAFDLLVDARGQAIAARPLADRRQRLERFFAGLGDPHGVRLSAATTSHAQAEAWMRELGAAGLDGVVAKRLDLPYRSGERDGMVKIKRMRTADCVVGGFRYAQKGGALGSLLLGLYDEGRLHHVGFTSSFTAGERAAIARVVLPRTGGQGFTGRAPGGPSRWSADRSTEWEPLDGSLVCEVRYDHFSGDRFRHGTRFLRWRPDKAPRQCTFDQVRPPRMTRVLKAMGIA